MKLIIDIPDNEYKQNKHYYDSVYHGIPLDSVTAKIIALPKTYPFVNHIDTYVKEDDVLQILDNIGKGESEGK